MSVLRLTKPGKQNKSRDIWSRETAVDVNFDLDGLRVSHMESRKSFTFKTVAANG